QSRVYPRPLRSFPTRRSSDLHASLGLPAGHASSRGEQILATRRVTRRAVEDDPNADGLGDDELPVNLAVAVDVASVVACDGELRSEEHTSELQSRENLVCRLL